MSRFFWAVREGPSPEVRWILKILHGPKHLILWELYNYSIVRPCRLQYQQYEASEMGLAKTTVPTKWGGLHVTWEKDTFPMTDFAVSINRGALT